MAGVGDSLAKLREAHALSANYVAVGEQEVTAGSLNFRSLRRKPGARAALGLRGGAPSLSEQQQPGVEMEGEWPLRLAVDELSRRVGGE